MVCPICGKRPAKRFCPAKGEKICAPCCGKEREVTIDCPPDCSYLAAAHRYEAEHRKPIPAGEIPYREMDIPAEFVYERWPVVAGLAAAILDFQVQNRELTDASAYSAIEALAETCRTLGSGIYYERPPGAPLAHALYGRIAEFVQESRKQGNERAGFSSLKDSEIFRLLVFLLRVARKETNGRPRSRAFLDFLRAHFPPLVETTAKETSRIIVP